MFSYKKFKEIFVSFAYGKYRIFMYKVAFDELRVKMSAVVVDLVVEEAEKVVNAKVLLVVQIVHVLHQWQLH